ncbi:ABC transporter [Rhizobium sp. ACO-34A]|nr:ABC transporter ATP-binding protein [Rhizobium sp. ACO-34A]ATN36483.1 ABC transporter [Rhizobium sp. ACO-34A]
MTLRLDALSFGHRGKVVGREVTLHVVPGEVLALFGPNGVGKTTLFKTMLGLMPALGGTVALDECALPQWSRAERARRIAYVPQAHAALFPFVARDVVLMGRAAHVSLFAMPGRADREIAEHSLSELGIAHLAGRPYTELSGGERQLVLIARALAQQAGIIVMDEPTASLDYGNQMRVLDCIRGLARDGRSIVLSTHDPGHVFLVADRVVLLKDGVVRAEGAPGEVLTAAAIREVYGVDVVVGTLEGGRAASCVPRLDDN